MDQLNLEKRGIPTVTVATTAFEELTRSSMKEHGISDMALVIMDHPVAGRSLEGIREKTDEAFPAILAAATEWQP